MKQQLLVRFLMCVFMTFPMFSTSHGQLPTYNPYILESAQLSNVVIFDVKVQGNYYFDTTWNIGKIYLNNEDSLVGYSIRYDLIKNQVELLWGTRRIGIYGANIDHFEWFSPVREQHQVFVTKHNFNFANPRNVAAFVEVLADGRVKLLKSRSVIARYQGTSPSLVPDDYTSATNMIEDYFLVMDGEVHKIRSKKKNLDFLGSDEIEEFVRENNLNFGMEEDLIRIVNRFNSEADTN